MRLKSESSGPEQFLPLTPAVFDILLALTGRLMPQFLILTILPLLMSMLASRALRRFSIIA